MIDPCMVTVWVFTMLISEYSFYPHAKLLKLDFLNIIWIIYQMMKMLDPLLLLLNLHESFLEY